MRSMVERAAVAFELKDSNGQTHRLQDDAGHWLLLVFHRHLGCPPCRQHVAQLRQQATQLEQLDVRVKVVTFDDDFLATAYARDSQLPWPLLRDHDQSLYRAYGLVHGNWWSIYGLKSIWKYLLVIWRGQRPGKPGKDWRQLGGDVLVDPHGIVRVHHISRSPHDRPSPQSLLAYVAANGCDLA